MANTEEPIGCLAAILRLFGIGLGRPITPPDLPYRQRDDFLSPAEFSFYRVLVSAIGNRAVVCPKVNLADVFYVARPQQNQTYRNKIDRKHVDFLVCDPNTMRATSGRRTGRRQSWTPGPAAAGRICGASVRGGGTAAAADTGPGGLQRECTVVTGGSLPRSDTSLPASNSAADAGDRPANLPEVRCADGATDGIQGEAGRAAVLRMPELSEVSGGCWRGERIWGGGTRAGDGSKAN